MSSSLSFFASVSFGHALYLHGGNVGVSSSRLSNELLRLDQGSSRVPVQVQTEGKRPAARSHHRGDVIQERFWVLVGGWDGRRRLSDVLVLDLAALKWLPMQATEESMCPVGLSGHAVCTMGTDTLIVSGREGGVREQRRFGGLFVLHVDPRQGRYTFREIDIVSQSRSGHSLHTLQQNQVLLLGGRSDLLTEIIHFNDSSRVKLASPTSSASQTSLRVSLMSSAKRLDRAPHGMRYHSAINLGDSHVLLHGGQDLGKSSSAEETTSRTLVVVVRRHGNNEDDVHWYHVEAAEETRAGHCLWLQEAEQHGGPPQVLVVGGVRGRQRRRGSLKTSAAPNDHNQPGPLDVVQLI